MKTFSKAQLLFEVCTICQNLSLEGRKIAWGPQEISSKRGDLGSGLSRFTPPRPKSSIDEGRLLQPRSISGLSLPFTYVPAYGLPVYASQHALPHTTQDSVPGCWLGFTRTAISGCRTSCACKAQPSPNRTYTFRYVSGSPETTAYLSYTTESVSRHVGDRTITVLALCPQSIPPASKHLGLLPPFATWTAFPSSDYYEGSAPPPSFPGLHG